MVTFAYLSMSFLSSYLTLKNVVPRALLKVIGNDIIRQIAYEIFLCDYGNILCRFRYKVITSLFFTPLVRNRPVGKSGKRLPFLWCFLPNWTRRLRQHGAPTYNDRETIVGIEIAIGKRNVVSITLGYKNSLWDDSHTGQLTALDKNSWNRKQN